LNVGDTIILNSVGLPAIFYIPKQPSATSPGNEWN